MADKPTKGLADVVAASTALSDIDGQAGRLFYRGYDIHDLAGRTAFEETRPPAPARHAAHAGAARRLGAELVRAATLGTAGRGQHRRDRARSRRRWRRCARWSRWPARDDPDKDSNAADANLRKAARLTAQQPILVARYHAARTRHQCPSPTRAEHRGELPAPDHRHAPGEREVDDLRRVPGAARRPHDERLDVRRPRLRRDAVRHALGRRRRDRHAQGPAARRRQRAGHADPGEHRRRRGVAAGRTRQARRGREDHGLRPPGLQDRGPARHPPAPDVAGARRGRPATTPTTGCRKEMEEVVLEDEGPLPERRLLRRDASTTTSASRPTCSPRSSRSAGWPAGPRTSSSSTPTTG